MAKIKNSWKETKNRQFRKCQKAEHKDKIDDGNKNYI